MWTKIIIDDKSTYPPPYKRLLFCTLAEVSADVYAPKPFWERRTKYHLYTGVYIPDYRGEEYPELKDVFPLLRLLDDYERNVTSSVDYWQLAPEAPIEINDTFENTFRRVNENAN
jgi:hypothetical protein